jgi:hypothetical protein
MPKVSSLTFTRVVWRTGRATGRATGRVGAEVVFCQIESKSKKLRSPCHTFGYQGVTTWRPKKVAISNTTQPTKSL